MSENELNMMDIDKPPVEGALALEHEIREPGIFKFLPSCNIPQNQECVIKIYYSIPTDCISIQSNNLETSQPLTQITPPLSDTSNQAIPSDLNLNVGTKRKPDSDPEPSTPIISKEQKGELRKQALNRARKRPRLDPTPEQESNGNGELDVPASPNLTQNGELDVVFGSLCIRIEEAAPDEPMVVEAKDGGMDIDSSLAWQDLEADEASDPMTVTEYSSEIISYLKELEKSTMPNPDYIKEQKEVTWDNRSTLMDWVVQVYRRFHVSPETLFLCVNIIDRFLSKRSIRLAKFQFLAVVAFSVACKYEEICPIPFKWLSPLFGEGCDATGKELFEGEIYLLKALDWNLSAPGPLTWLRRGSKADDDYDVQSRTIAKYLMAIGCLEHRMMRFVPSLVAAAGLWLARLSLGKTEWTANLQHYTTYSEKEMIPVAQVMLEHVLLSRYAYKQLYEMFSYKRHLRASVHFHKWARTHWKEDSKIDLERDLPSLKAGTLKAGDSPQAINADEATTVESAMEVVS